MKSALIEPVTDCFTESLSFCKEKADVAELQSKSRFPSISFLALIFPSSLQSVRKKFRDHLPLGPPTCLSAQPRDFRLSCQPFGLIHQCSYFGHNSLEKTLTSRIFPLFPIPFLYHQAERARYSLHHRLRFVADQVFILSAACGFNRFPSRKAKLLVNSVMFRDYGSPSSSPSPGMDYRLVWLRSRR